MKLINEIERDWKAEITINQTELGCSAEVLLLLFTVSGSQLGKVSDTSFLGERYVLLYFYRRSWLYTLKHIKIKKMV